MNICISVLFCLLVSVFGEDRQRSFSLFNVVQFKNEACQAVSDANLQGTCYTSQECTDLGGTADGNCANGFGTCCIIIVAGTVGACGGTVTQNCSYIQNIDYPAADTNSQTCTYMVTKCSSDICHIRLDFVTTTIGQPVAATGVCTTGDNLVLTPGSGSLVAGATAALTNVDPPILCGTLTGQHVYLDAGTGTNAATLALTTLATSNADGTKNWRIKVSQIECDSKMRPPQGCLQWNTGATNVFTSFNWDGTPLNVAAAPGNAAGQGRLLSSQYYKVCFRQEEGMCKIQYSESPIDTTGTGINAFDLQATVNGELGQTRLDQTVAAAATCGAAGDAYLIINGAEPHAIDAEAAGNNIDPLDVFCGAYLCNAHSTVPANSCITAENAHSTVVASAIPFSVQFHQNGDTGAAQAGFSLQATQIPCGRSDGGD